MRETDGPPVRIEGLTVRYDHVTACANVSLSVSAGSVYVLLGRDGAGKSSLIRCLLGQEKPASGCAFLFGASAWTTRKSAMARTGVAPEEPDAPPAMTAEQLSEFYRRIYPRWDGPGFSSRLARLGSPATVPFGKLSAPQRGQVMLALALGNSPALLVLDGPALGTDTVARQMVGEIAESGTAVFLTTRDPAGFEDIATHVGILKQGRLLHEADVGTLRSRFRRIRYVNRPTETRTEFGNELDEFEAVKVQVRGWGIEAVVSNFAPAAFERFRALDGIDNAEAEAMSVGEIFTSVAGEQRPTS